MHSPQFAGAIHGAILIGLAWRSSTHLTTKASHRLCSTYLLTWCNLVYTALILSVFSALDHLTLYFSVSLALATGLELFLHFRNILPHSRQSKATFVKARRFDRLLGLLLGVVLVWAALGTFLICIRYVPNNWDACAYRLSRAFFYLAHGNLLHPGNPPDPRVSYYPFNGMLLYVFLAIYQFPAQSYNFISALTWSFAGLASYCAARSLGASRMGGFVAAWVCLLTPNVLVQGASGNDEILAAVPILMGLTFAVEWVYDRRLRYAILAGIGLGLGFGTKLHWAFYWLFFCIASGAVIVRLLRLKGLRAQILRRLPSVLAAAAIAAPLAGAFLICNYISSKRFSDTAFNDQVLNTPFQVALAREKVQTSTGEMLLSPIPDLVPPLHPARRRLAYAAFNRFFLKCCFANLVLTTKRSPEGYQFIGPADQHAFLPAETTVWLGFLPHFTILAVLILVFARKVSVASLVLIAAFWLWHFTYAAETRYIWWACTYYCFPAILSVAAIGLIWDIARSSHGAASRFLMASFLALFATHMLLSANLLAFGELRNVQFLLNPSRRAPDMHAVDRPVAAALASARAVYIPTTHWEVLLWNLMRYNLGARYSTGQLLQLPAANTLMLLSIAPDVARTATHGENVATARLAVRLPHGAAPALTYLGKANGDQVFAQGDGIELRYPDRDGYALLDITWRQDPASGVVLGAESKCCIGLQPSNQVAFRYAFQSTATAERTGTDWSVANQSRSTLSVASNKRYDTLVIETENLTHPDTIERTVYPLSEARYEVGKTELSLKAPVQPESATATIATP